MAALPQGPVQLLPCLHLLCPQCAVNPPAICPAAGCTAPLVQQLQPYNPPPLRPIVGAAGAAVGAALTPLIVGGVLCVIGFSPIGPVAGSIAAVWQATMGGTVAAGGVFALCQSMAMGGALPGAAYAVGAAAGAAAGAALGSRCARCRGPV